MKYPRSAGTRLRSVPDLRPRPMLLHAASFSTSLCPRGACVPTKSVAKRPSQRPFSAPSASCQAVGLEKLIVASLVLALFGTRPHAIASCSVAVFLTSSAAACATLDCWPSSMGVIAAIRFWIRFCAGRTFCASLTNTSP